MSYLNREGLSGVSDYLNKAVSALDSAKVILDDPALPEVTSLILKLNKLEQKKPKMGGPPVPVTKGIGLHRVVKPLRLYVKTREQPVLGYVIIAAAVGIPFMLGYLIGKR